MLGSLMVAFFSVSTLKPFKPFIANKIFPLIERFYEKVIRILRLPHRLFPSK